MITASHNAPSDNGFKCYASTGGQVVPPDDSGIIACVKEASDREIPEKDYDEALPTARSSWSGPRSTTPTLHAVVEQSVSHARDVSIVYTPMHGVGETSVAASLIKAGFAKVNVPQASQRTPDGDFANVPGHVSNPEIPKTLDLAIAEAKATGADLVLASDPDADRIGVGLPVTGDPSGAWTTLDGNQIGALLAAFVMKQTKGLGLLRPDHYLVTTLVSTEMVRDLADAKGSRSRTTCWSASSGSPSGSTRMGRSASSSDSRSRTATSEGDARPRQGRRRRLAPLRRAGRDRQGPPADHPRIPRRPVHRRRPLRRTPGQQDPRRPRGGRPDPEADGRLPIEPAEVDRRAGPDRGPRLQDPRGPPDHRRPGQDHPLPEPSGDILIFQTEAPGTRFAVRPSGTEPKIKLYLFARSDTSGISDRVSLAEIKAKTTAPD